MCLRFVNIFSDFCIKKPSAKKFQTKFKKIQKSKKKIKNKIQKIQKNPEKNPKIHLKKNPKIVKNGQEIGNLEKSRKISKDIKKKKFF